MRFFRHSQLDSDMDEELRSQIQHRADDLERSGVGRAEAQRRARIEFGDHGRYMEECREALRSNFIETLVLDTRFSVRLLRKSPGFTIVAVLTLALAIGANAVVFGVLNGLILRPLNVPKAESLYAIQRGSGHDPIGESYPDYLDLRDRNRSFDGLAGFNVAQAGLDTGKNPSRVWLAIADLNSIGTYLKKTYFKDHGQMTFKLTRPGLLSDFLGSPAREFLTGLMLLAGLILLAACANLGSLFGARAADRSREVALRVALGSSRNRILRGPFTEASLISLMGGAVGLIGSVALLRELSVWQPVARFPLNIPVDPDANVYAIALVLALMSGILFGIVPVRQLLETDPYQIVKSGSTGTVGRRIMVRDLLLGVQIAICAVLVTSSIVAVRELMRSHSDIGFEPRNAMLMETVLHMAGYSGSAEPAMQRRMIDAMENIPA